MSASRTLKLNILAETKDLVSGLNKAQDATEKSSSRMSDGLKKVGIALAAAGAAAAAYAGKLIVDGVKAAIEDEAAQVRLAEALKNTTGATNEQIAAIEKQILQTSLATGVADDKLRPAYQRLAVATGDTAKANDLLRLSMDISAATGKDLESVTNAVGRAYEGSTTALSRLGIGLSAADITALGLEGTMGKLNEQFGGAAQAQAETFEGKMARLKVAFDETKETVGAALLPVLTEMFDFVTRNLVPIFEKLADDFNKNVRPAFEKLWEFIKENVLPIFVALGKFIFEELVPTYRDFLKPVIEQVIGILERLFNRVENNKESFNRLGEVLDKLWFFIQNYIIPIFSFLIESKLKELERALNLVAGAIQFVIDNFNVLSNLVPALKLLGLTWEQSGAAAAYAAEKSDEQRKSWFESTTYLMDSTIPAVGDFDAVMGNLTDSTLSATNATKSFTSATRESTEALKAEFTALQALDLFRAGFGAQVGGVVQPGSAQIKGQLPGGETFRSAAEIVGQFGGLIPGFNAKPGDPYYGFTKGDTIGSFVRPGTTGNTNVTINVNATVADPEGVARAISEVLVGSAGRAGNIILQPVLGLE
jgi:hypothetical protein